MTSERDLAKHDLPFTIVNLGSSVLALILPFVYYSKSSILAFSIFYTITGLGLTLGYHRLFAHRAFQVALWLEHLIAFCGYLAIQRGPIFWVAMHRLHHKFTDVPGKDPHTPKEGFWHVHFGWTQKRRSDVWDRDVYRTLAPELLGDRFYLALDSELCDYATYVCLLISSYLLGGLIGPAPGFDSYNALCFLVWIGILNRVALLHAFGLINSVCHTFGAKPFKTKTADESVNNFLVALLIFGEGWHNNHHTFPTSARQGLRWYQVDVAWYVIWILNKLGLARRVRRARPESIRKKLRRQTASPRY